MKKPSNLGNKDTLSEQYLIIRLLICAGVVVILGIFIASLIIITHKSANAVPIETIEKQSIPPSHAQTVVVSGKEDTGHGHSDWSSIVVAIFLGIITYFKKFGANSETFAKELFEHWKVSYILEWIIEQVRKL